MDRPHGPGHSLSMFIVVECEDHSAIQAPHSAAIVIKLVSPVYWKDAHLVNVTWIDSIKRYNG